MAFAPSASWNSRSITHLANYPSPSLPMIFSDESTKNPHPSNTGLDGPPAHRDERGVTAELQEAFVVGNHHGICASCLVYWDYTGASQSPNYPTQAKEAWVGHPARVEGLGTPDDPPSRLVISSRE